LRLPTTFSRDWSSDVCSSDLQKITELGAGTRKLVKATSTLLIMSLFTYLLFNVRAAQQLSLTLLLGIALIYAVRDLLRDDLIDRSEERRVGREGTDREQQYED